MKKTAFYNLPALAYLKSLSALTDRFISSRLQGHRWQIGLGQYRFVMRVVENPGITQDQLSSRLSIDKSATAKAVKFLLEKEFITRETDQIDRRVKHLYPAEKAYAFYRALREEFPEWEKIIYDQFTDEEIHIFTILSAKASEAAKKYVAETKLGGEV